MSKAENLPAAQGQPAAEIVERVVLQGDLSKLAPAERVAYYRAVCESVGLNPLTRPFEYLVLNGRMILYARKDCADQLRSLKGVSIVRLEREEVAGVYVVTARARDKAGREDSSIGAVSIEGLKGDARANALMKAECVPLDSEMLTRNGFKARAMLEIGEEVLAYDCERDVTEWVPLENLTDYACAPVVEMRTEKGQFRVVCTPDHSWAVCREPYRPDGRGDGSRGPRGPYQSRGPERLLAKAHDIKTSHRIILAGACVDAGASLLTPIESAVLGWAVTDGTIKWVGRSVRIGICQSKPKHMPAIRQLAGAMAGGVKEFVSPARARTFPTGRTYDTKPQHWWYLPAAVSRDLLDKAGYTCQMDLPRIVTQLDHAARQAMLEAMMAAEGDARRVFANSNRHVLEAFQILCALEGFATGGAKKRSGCFTQRLKKTRHIAGNGLVLETVNPRAVWCPTTKYGTWVMRQNGQVTITGNTKAKRRVTLSICGLGFLDESEVEAVREARPVRVSDDGEIVENGRRQLAHDHPPPALTPEEVEEFGERARNVLALAEQTGTDFVTLAAGMRKYYGLTTQEGDELEDAVGRLSLEQLRDLEQRLSKKKPAATAEAK